MAKPTESPAYKRAVARMKKRLGTAKKPVVRDQAALARKATAKRRAAQVKAMKKPKKKPTGFFSQEMPEGKVSQMKKTVAPISKKKSTKKPVVRDQATLARKATAKRRAAQVKAMKTPTKKSTGFFSQEMPEGKVSQMRKKVAPISKKKSTGFFSEEMPEGNVSQMKKKVVKRKNKLNTAKKPVVRDQATLAREETAKRRAAQVKAMKTPKKKSTGFFSQEMPEGNVSQMKKRVAPAKVPPKKEAPKKKPNAVPLVRLKVPPIVAATESKVKPKVAATESKVKPRVAATESKVKPRVAATESKVKPKVAPSLDKLSFGKAFNKSRREHGGPGGMFTWKGKKYQTNIKGEDYVKNPKSVWKSNSDDNDLTEVRATGGKVTNKSRIKSTIRMTSGGGVGTKLIDDIYNA